MGAAWDAGLKSPEDHQQSTKYYHWDFVAKMHNDIFRRKMDRALFYCPKPFWETQLTKQEDPHKIPLYWAVSFLSRGEKILTQLGMENTV
jgi:hypothetical protein